MGMRIGIFGGSFDPIHNGHLLLAELSCESLELDQVRFVIANVSPFKVDRQPVSNQNRLEMVRIAIEGNPRFEIDTREIDRGGVSYTIDTCREIAKEFPGAALFLLMGADALADIAKWREPYELFKLVTPGVISRGGFGSPPWDCLAPYVSPLKLTELKDSPIVAPQIEISSQDIRERIQGRKSIRYQVPPAVEDYIREQQLYRS